MRSAAASYIQPRFQDGAQSDKTPRCSSKTSSRQTLYATGALVLFADLASARAASAPRHPRGGIRAAAEDGKRRRVEDTSKAVQQRACLWESPCAPTYWVFNRGMHIR